jgi:hypothetical protein
MKPYIVSKTLSDTVAEVESGENPGLCERERSTYGMPISRQMSWNHYPRIVRRDGILTI